VRYNTPTEADSSTVWTATAKYDITPNLFVRGLVGTSFKLPTAEELYAIDPFELGNPELKPETSRNLNVSIGGNVPLGLRALQWELIGFVQNVNDLISTETNDDGVDVFLNVPGKVKVRGGGLSLAASLGAGLTARMSYTLSSTEDPSGAQVSRIPKSIGQAGLEYRHPEARLTLSAVANYVGDVRASGVKYGNYAVFDLSASYFADQEKHHRLILSLQNAFDRTYVRPATGFSDVDGSPYRVLNVGQPRLLLGRYVYSF
jgi:vitamin B12 transporter